MVSYYLRHLCGKDEWLHSKFVISCNWTHIPCDSRQFSRAEANFIAKFFKSPLQLLLWISRHTAVINFPLGHFWASHNLLQICCCRRIKIVWKIILNDIFFLEKTDIMKRNHRAQSLLFASLYELCILVSALALSIEFNTAPSE